MKNSSIFKFKFGPFGRFSHWLWTFAQSEHQLFDCEIIKSISANGERWEAQPWICPPEWLCGCRVLVCCLEASVEERPLPLDVVKRVLLIKTQLLLKSRPFCQIFLPSTSPTSTKSSWRLSILYTSSFLCKCTSEWTETATQRVEVCNSHTEDVLRVHGKITLGGRWVK